MVRQSIWTGSFFVISVALIVAGGCAQFRAQKPPIQSGYGRSTGRGYTTSVNGTGALKELIRKYDFKVNRYTKVSPRLDRYQTVIWFPDNYAVPRDEVVQRIEQWLSDGWEGGERTLVYVGRDYNAEVTYWEKMAHQATGPQQLEYRRRRAIAIANGKNDRELSGKNDSSCKWFEIVDRGYQESKTLGGPLADNLDEPPAELTFDRILVPPSNVRYDVKVLLEVNGQPFVYSLSRPNWSEGKIIVVANGSFLLNLPLVNRENRALAEAFLSETLYYDPVLFLESTGPIAVSDRDTPNQHNQWSWIRNPPLSYIVPQLLFWCVLFCFVYFPIFGRPAKLPKPSTTNFRDHIRALGHLLERADSEAEAKQWIADYHAHSAHQRTRKS